MVTGAPVNVLDFDADPSGAIDSTQAIQAAIATGDWDQFKNAAYKVKWNPNGFLISDSEKERYAAEEAEQKEKDEAYKIKILTDKNLNHYDFVQKNKFVANMIHEDGLDAWLAFEKEIQRQYNC